MTTLRLSRTRTVLHLSALPARLFAFAARLFTFAAIARSRQGLARLDDHLLRDIGVTRAEAMAEANRAPWDPPSHWKS